MHQIGERLDQLIYVVGKALGSTAREPAPWRRPGVLGARELAAIEAHVAAPVISDLNAERAAREAARAAQKQ